jgi:Major Facilitator Superfamily
MVSLDLIQAQTSHPAAAAVLRLVVIGLAAFLTVVDLFATKAILPSLVRVYGVSPAAMGVAVNASTFGMAIGGLAVAFFSSRINRRPGALFSLVRLSLPIALLAVAPGPTTFTALRVVQSLFMSSAFTLTLAYFAEETSGEESAAALRRLHHWECREQPVWPSDVRLDRRHARAGGKLLRVCGSEPRGRTARLH